MAENWEILGQLFLAMVLAGFLGLERVFAGKVAGLRTFALVSMGSALLVIVSEQVSQRYLGLVDFDPLRMASQIIMGIGFLGAGLIIFFSLKIINPAPKKPIPMIICEAILKGAKSTSPKYLCETCSETITNKAEPMLTKAKVLKPATLPAKTRSKPKKPAKTIAKNNCPSISQFSAIVNIIHHNK